MDSNNSDFMFTCYSTNILVMDQVKEYLERQQIILRYENNSSDINTDNVSSSKRNEL